MKKMEQIKSKIEMLEQQIEWTKEQKDLALAEVSTKIDKYKDDPEYVAKWINNWLNEVNYHKKQIEDLNKELSVLYYVVS